MTDPHSTYLRQRLADAVDGGVTPGAAIRRATSPCRETVPPGLHARTCSSPRRGTALTCAPEGTTEVMSTSNRSIIDRLANTAP